MQHISKAQISLRIKYSNNGIIFILVAYPNECWQPTWALINPARMRRLIRAFDGLIYSNGGTDILSVRLPLWEIKISAITCKETSREYGVLLLRYFQLNFRKLLQSKKSNANQNRIKFNRKFLRILIYCIPNTLTLDVKTVKRNKRNVSHTCSPFTMDLDVNVLFIS